MAHCPLELLDDLADLLARVRSWVGVVEKSPGVFYVHGQRFLHFHLVKGGGRRGDIKGRAGWMQLDLPRPIAAARWRALSRELQAQYGERERPLARVRRRRPDRRGR